MTTTVNYCLLFSFKMQSGVVICADPSMRWVKTLVEAKQKEMVKKMKLKPTKKTDQAKTIAPTKEVNHAKEMVPAKELSPNKEVDQAEEMPPAKELPRNKEVDQAKEMAPAKKINQEIYVQYCFRSIWPK